MTLSVSTRAAKGSTLSSRKGFPIAQPTSTITGSTKIAICTPFAAHVNALLLIRLTLQQQEQSEALFVLPQVDVLCS